MVNILISNLLTRRIHELYVEKIYNYVYYRIGNHQEAEDLTAKVFHRALNHIPNYNNKGVPFAAWLYRIARNVVSDHLRAHERESAAFERTASDLEPHDPGPEQQVEAKAAVLAALGELTEDQQQVVSLRYFAGFTTAEIAASMERSERAIYSLEVRALASMRRVLEEPGAFERKEAGR